MYSANNVWFPPIRSRRYASSCGTFIPPDGSGFFARAMQKEGALQQSFLKAWASLRKYGEAPASGTRFPSLPISRWFGKHFDIGTIEVLRSLTGAAEASTKSNTAVTRSRSSDLPNHAFHFSPHCATRRNSPFASASGFADGGEIRPLSAGSNSLEGVRNDIVASYRPAQSLFQRVQEREAQLRVDMGITTMEIHHRRKSAWLKQHKKRGESPRPK